MLLGVQVARDDDADADRQRLVGSKKLGRIRVEQIDTHTVKQALTQGRSQFDAASRVTSLSYVQIVFAAMLGWLFFDEIPTQATLLGGGLILMGAAVSAWLQPKAVST